MSAEVLFEDHAHAGTEVYFEVPGSRKDYLKPCYEAFLFSSFPAALYHHEKRIKIAGAVCPEALMNVSAALHLQKQWHKIDCPVPRLEFDKETVRYPSQDGRAACFLSGGVDSLSNFCRNVTTYPPDHPKRFKSAIYVYGMDVGDPNKPARLDIFDQSRASLQAFTSKYGCELVPVYTNARDLEPNWVFYQDYQHGPLMAGTAHSLSGKITDFSVAFDFHVNTYEPYGSHPHFNKYFSSSFMRAEGVMDAYQRHEKYQFFKAMPEALTVLRVCYMMPDIQDNQINCGKCKKCLLTKMGLLANGLLDDAVTFPDKSITLEGLREIKNMKFWYGEFWGGLIAPLREMGYSDMADILQKEWDHPTGGPSLLRRAARAVKARIKRKL